MQKSFYFIAEHSGLIRYKVVKLATSVEGDPKAQSFDSHRTEALGRAPLHSLDCSTLPLPYYAEC